MTALLIAFWAAVFGLTACGWAAAATWAARHHRRHADQLRDERDDARRGERQAHARLDILRTFVADHLDHFIPAQRTGEGR